MATRFSASKQHTEKTEKKWLIPLLIGFLVPLTACGVYFYLRPPLDAATRNAARKLHCDPYQLADDIQLLTSAEKNHDLSNGDWQRVLSYYNGDNAIIKRDALSVMMMMGTSPRRNQILNLTRPLLTGNDPDMTEAELILLWRFHDPSWKQEALLRKDDKAHPLLSETATELLERHGGDSQGN